MARPLRPSSAPVTPSGRVHPLAVDVPSRSWTGHGLSASSRCAIQWDSKAPPTAHRSRNTANAGHAHPVILSGFVICRFVGSVALMTADALTDAQRAQALPVVGPGGSWGLATGVDVEAAEPWMAPGRWGWDGGTGTTAYVDPRRRTVGVLLTQRAMTGPLDGFGEFWTAVAAAA